MRINQIKNRSIKRFFIIFVLILIISFFSFYLLSTKASSNKSSMKNMNHNSMLEESSSITGMHSGHFHLQDGPFNWSDTAAWNSGTVPVDGENVTIPSGRIIVLDGATANLGSLEIDGTLLADPSVDVAINATDIMIMNGGTLEIGNNNSYYTKKAIITLTGARGTHTTRSEDNALNNDGIARGLHVENGGTLQLFGNTSTLTKTKLSANAEANSTTLSIVDNVDWKEGDKIAISITDFFGVGSTEILTLASNATNNTLNLTTPLQTFRWGILQYPTDNVVNGTAMSLTQGNFTPASTSTPTVLDERAEIVLLSRGIVVQGVNDSFWQNNGFGVHIMIEGLNSTAQADGIEIRQGGQSRAMGRYPWHWHMLSYTPYVNSSVQGGAYLGDVTPGTQFLRNSAIWDSQNRAVTIHGTNGVLVDTVFAVDIKGHAFFMEDGSEQNNTIKNSIAMKARDPNSTNRLKLHDEFASGFWLTNPNNTIINNSASDNSGQGLWNTFSQTPFGLSRNVSVEPIFIPVKQFDDNIGHSNRLRGIETDEPVGAEDGSIGGGRYLERYNVVQEYNFFMRRNKIWKNLDGGYVNRVMIAHYMDWTAADNNGRDFRGSTLGSAIMNGTLLIGHSLNNATAFSDPTRVGVSSYHYELMFINITAINYELSDPVNFNDQFTYAGGVFDGSDLYTESIGLLGLRNSGWRLINAYPGYLTPPPFFDGFPIEGQGHPGFYRYWALPGSTWDPYGYWGPAGNYLLASTNLFYTYNLSSYVNIEPAGQNGISTPDRFFGLDKFQIGYPDAPGWWGMIPVATLKLARLNISNMEIANHTLGDPNVSVFFNGMRSFGIANGGRYVLTYPDGEMPNSSFQIAIEGGYRANDTVLLGLPWNNSIPVTGYLDIDQYIGSFDLDTRIATGRSRMFNSSGTSIADVLNDTTGVTIWQDRLNNRVWVNFVGGLYWDSTGYDPAAPDAYNLLRTHKIRLYYDSNATPFNDTVISTNNGGGNGGGSSGGGGGASTINPQKADPSNLPSKNNITDNKIIKKVFPEVDNEETKISGFEYSLWFYIFIVIILLVLGIIIFLNLLKSKILNR